MKNAKRQSSKTSLLTLIPFTAIFIGLGIYLLVNSFAAATAPGDANGDGTVNVQDLSILLTNWKTNYPAADFNGDQTVNVLDLSILLSKWGTNSSQSYIFQDEFNGATGSAPDASKWTLRGEICDPPADYACPKNSNVFQDGAGNLVLRTKRESSNWLTGGPYSGAWLSSFTYGSGWPASGVKASLPVPYKIEMRAIMPNTVGAWPSIWTINVDRPTTQNIYELDVAEERMTTPTSAGCHQHTWLGGADKGAWDGGVNVSDMGLNWHVYSANVYTDRVEYKVDTQACGTAYGVSGKQGIILNNLIAKPGSWGSAGGQPSTGDPGPWDFKIDYIRVSAL